jgi:hypothetical protein
MPWENYFRAVFKDSLFFQFICFAIVLWVDGGPPRGGRDWLH